MWCCDAVLHDAMAHEAHEGTNARSLREDPDLAIGAGAMGLVGEQQAAEVTFGTFLVWGFRSKSITTTGLKWVIVEAIDPLK